MSKLTGRDVLAAGIPQGPAVGAALATFALHEREEAMLTLRDIAQHPERYRQHDNPLLMQLASILERHQQRVEREKPVELTSARAFPIVGEHLIDPKAVQQMRDATRLPVTLAAALMPDAHVGYGIPIGGVWALDHAVSPYAVGVDIACRMKLTVFDAAPDAISTEDLQQAIARHTRFGSGSHFEGDDRNGHPVLDSPEWDEHPHLKKNPHLRDTAHAQLGSSGGGNHFVDVGAYTGEDGQPRLAVMSHSGSRGLGARLADHYSKLAMSLQPGLPSFLKHLAWLDLDTEEGDAYWRAMTLAGRYAQANHHAIHARLTEHFRLDVLDSIEHHHNFAWRERITTPDRERSAVVHRKGATPARDGERGIIPGSMSTPAYVVRGTGNPATLQSASHGSGRTMSRKAAKQALAGLDLHAALQAEGITLLGGALDEAPLAYKDIRQVIAAQTDSVDVIGEFQPFLVRMAD